MRGMICNVLFSGIGMICVAFPTVCLGNVNRAMLDRIVTNRVASSRTLSLAQGWISKARRVSGASDGDIRQALEAYITASATSEDRTVQSQNCAMAIRAYSTVASTNGFAFLSTLAREGTNEVARTAYEYFCQVAPIPQRIAFSEELLDSDSVVIEMKTQVWLEWENVIAWRSCDDAYRESVVHALLRRRNHSRDGARCESMLRKGEHRRVLNDESRDSETRARRIRIMREALIRK